MNSVDQFGLAASNWLSQGTGHIMLLVDNFLVLLVLFVLMLLFSYKGGRGGLISLILGLYAGYAIFTLFPFTNDIIAAGGTSLVKAVISIILYGICTYLPYHFMHRLTKGGFGVLSFFPRFILSFLAAAFLLALAYHVFHISNVYTFPEPMNTLFAPDKYFFWWFIAPMAGLLFLVH